VGAAACCHLALAQGGGCRALACCGQAANSESCRSSCHSLACVWVPARLQVASAVGMLAMSALPAWGLQQVATWLWLKVRPAYVKKVWLARVLLLFTSDNRVVMMALAQGEACQVFPCSRCAQLRGNQRLLRVDFVTASHAFWYQHIRNFHNLLMLCTAMST
jgi:hypothetical protein